MTIKPRWEPAETEHGSRAFTATIGTVDVRVTFEGDPTAVLTGAWEVVDADDGTVLLEGNDSPLAGSRSAVQVYASLVSIAEQLEPLLIADPVPASRGVEHRVVKLVADDRDLVFARTVEATLGELAADGWRLVSVDNLWAYLERPRTSSDPA